MRVNYEKTTQDNADDISDILDIGGSTYIGRDSVVDIQLNELERLQARLNLLAEHNSEAIAVVLEGRDTAGKSGTIRALTH